MPALFERGGKDYGHYLDGDGYIAKLVFLPDGQVRFQSKFVSTGEIEREKEADKTLYRSTFRTQREPRLVDLPGAGTVDINNALDLKLKNPSNTAVVFWGGRLFSLFEAGVPYEIDPVSLATLGISDLNVPNSELRPGVALLIPSLYKALPQLHNAFTGASATAHPKIDPHTNRLVSWIWRAEVSPDRNPLDTRPVLSFFEWDEGLNVVESGVRVRLSSTNVAPHDFSLTPNYYVLIENRVSGDTMPYIRGTSCPASCVDIEPRKPMVINLVPRRARDSGSDYSAALRLALAPGFAIHCVCAFEDEGQGTVTLLFTGWKQETVESGQVKGGLLGSWEGRAPLFDQIPPTLLYKTVVDVGKEKILFHGPVPGLENTIIEHPHINPKNEGKEVRFAWMSVGSQTGLSSPPLGYMRLDLQTGEQQVWMAPVHNFCEEVVVVPKGVADDEDEDDVWILATIFDSVRERSSVAVFDGKRLEVGPVARVWLKNRLPHSLNGVFSRKVF
jgi:all-trans-8'-apo-beta-carotenal 15,15'-oxygenase